MTRVFRRTVRQRKMKLDISDISDYILLLSWKLGNSICNQTGHGPYVSSDGTTVNCMPLPKPLQRYDGLKIKEETR